MSTSLYLSNVIRVIFIMNHFMIKVNERLL